MANITTIRTKVLSHMADMDLGSMTLMDISLYVDILRRVSDISEKPYLETIMETMKQGFNNCSTDVVSKDKALALGFTGGAL